MFPSSIEIVTLIILQIVIIQTNCIHDIFCQISIRCVERSRGTLFCVHIVKIAEVIATFGIASNSK